MPYTPVVWPSTVSTSSGSSSSDCSDDGVATRTVVGALVVPYVVTMAAMLAYFCVYWTPRSSSSSSTPLAGKQAGLGDAQL